jgi:hypothetical protein
MFPCPSPRGTNNAGLFLNKAGELVDRRGGLWGRPGTMALDELPESLSTEHLPPSTELGPWHDSVRKHTLGDEDDVDNRIDLLRHYLRGRGLSEDDVEEACALAAKGRGEVEDELPVSGPAGMGGALSKQSREANEKVFRSPGRFESRPALGTKATGEKRSPVDYRSSPASDSFFLEKFPEAARIKPGYEPPESERPLTRAERRRAHDMAMDADSTADLARMFGEHFASIGIGDFPRRRR